MSEQVRGQFRVQTFSAFKFATIGMALLVSAHGQAATAGNSKEISEVTATKAETTPSTATVTAFSSALAKVRSALGSAGSRLKSVDIKFNIPVDVIKSENFNFGGIYTFESEPLYQGNIHLRADHWTAKLAIPVGDSVSGIDGNSFGAEVTKQARITFVRPFPDRSYSSRQMLAYSPARMPWTADIALERLEPGDVAVLTSEMSLLVEATTAPSIAKALQSMNKALPFATTHYLLRGEFQIHVTRLEGSWVQLKIVPVFGDETGLKVAVKPAQRLEIFGVRLVDKAIERWSRIDDGGLFAEFVRRDGFLGLVNYKLNLHPANKEIRQAYNTIMRNALSLGWLDRLRFGGNSLSPDDLGGFVGLFAAAASPEVFRLFNPLQDRATKLQGLIADTGELEDLLKRSLVIAPDKRAIDREFFGRAEYNEPLSTRFGINLLFWSVSRGAEYKDLFIAAESDRGKDTEYYRVGLFERTTDFNLFFSLYRQRAISTASAVFKSDAHKNITGLEDLIFEWEYRDKSLDAKEQRMIRESLQQSLPASVYTSINWGGFEPSAKYKNAELKLRMVFGKEALTELSALDLQMGHQWEKLNQYLLSIPAPTAPPSTEPGSDGERSSTVRQLENGRLTSTDMYKADIETIATKLTAVLEGQLSTANGIVRLTPNEQYEAFADLRNNALFIEVGAGYLLSLIPESSLRKVVGFEFALTADDVSPAMLPEAMGRRTQQFKNITTIRGVLRTGVRGSLADLYQDVAQEVTRTRLQRWLESQPAAATGVKVPSDRN